MNKCNPHTIFVRPMSYFPPIDDAGGKATEPKNHCFQSEHCKVHLKPVWMHLKSKLLTTNTQLDSGDTSHMLTSYSCDCKATQLKVNLSKHNAGGRKPFEKLKLAGAQLDSWDNNMLTSCLKMRLSVLTHFNAIVPAGENRNCYHSGVTLKDIRDLKLRMTFTSQTNLLVVKY